MVYESVDVDLLKGKTLIGIYRGEYDSNDSLTFYTDDGEEYRMTHVQDCCENVYIEDICGNIDDLLDSPLLMSEEVSDDNGPLGSYDESYTWTFYKFATNKGCVTIRWYGTSNGYYSESVSFIRVA